MTNTSLAFLNAHRSLHTSTYANTDTSVTRGCIYWFTSQVRIIDTCGRKTFSYHVRSVWWKCLDKNKDHSAATQVHITSLKHMQHRGPMCRITNVKVKSCLQCCSQKQSLLQVIMHLESGCKWRFFFFVHICICRLRPCRSEAVIQVFRVQVLLD